ncbi:MAG: DUF4465 domain-containing protein [Bacteroidales bacterium]
MIKSVQRCVFFLFVISVLFSCDDEDNFKTDMADFEDFKLVKNYYWNGVDGSGEFTYRNKIFSNTYYSDLGTFSGFAYSNLINDILFTDSSVYASYPSGGANESKNYAVAHQHGKIFVTFSDTIKGEEPVYVMLANTTYTAMAIKYGLSNVKKFGGYSGDDPDWLKVSIYGYPIWGGITGPVEFYLADYRSTDNSSDYIAKAWNYIDLSSLGNVKRLEFQITSSDASTPLYFCLDDLKGRIHN